MDNLRDDPRVKKLMERVKKEGYESSPIQVYNYSSPRQSTRATFFAGKSSPGQLAINYGAPKWQEKYEDALENEKFINRRWRFGANFWTNFDTNIPLTIGGQKIEPGLYYLTITHKGDRKCVLNVLDSASVRKYRIDPYVAHLTKRGTDVELEHKETNDVAEKLDIKIKVKKQQPGKGALVIRFGPHTLTAPL